MRLLRKWVLQPPTAEALLSFTRVCCLFPACRCSGLVTENNTRSGLYQVTFPYFLNSKVVVGSKVIVETSFFLLNPCPS